MITRRRAARWRRLLPFLAICIACCHARAAQAGPWTLSAGDVRVYVGVEHRVDDADFDANGDPADGARRQLSVSTTSEFGATDWLTIGVSSEGRWSRIESDGRDGVNLGVTRYGGALRARLYDEDGVVASVQTGVGVAGRNDPNLRPELDDGASEAEFRGLVGYGFGSDWGNGWLAGEAAYRARDNDAADQVRLDATAGLRPPIDEDLMLMLQGFGVVAAGSGERSDFDSFKLAPSVAYEATDWVTVRVGASREVIARGVEPGTTVMLDFWFSY